MKFALKVWKLLVGIKDGLALLFLLVFFAALFGVLSMRPVAGKVTDGALVLDLDGRVVEEKSAPDPVNIVLSREAPVNEYLVRDLVRALDTAAKDKRIKVVVLDLSRFLGGGQVDIRTLGGAIDQVRAAKKPVLAFANAYADDGVLLAAHASEVWVDPMGGAFVSGPGGSALYFKGLFDRFGVNAHIYRAGTYKSAVEPYFLSGMSDKAREDYEGVYGALWAGWKADLAKARPKASIDLITRDPAAWAQSGKGNLAEASKASGLVDRIGDKTEFEARVTQLVGAAPATASDDLPYANTSLATWLAANPAPRTGAKIGVVTVAGTIVDGDAGPGEAGGDRIAGLLDDNIDEGFKALVVRVNSPGGSVMASERIRRAIARYKARKIPVVISMGNLAASGGYWVSTTGDRIFAQPDTITGSIGVFAVATSFEKTLAKFGVTTDGVKTTPLSGEPDVLAGFSPEVDALLQASVDGTYARFTELAAKARHQSVAQIDAIAQGRVWAGAEAQKVGLVDQMGGLDAALAYAAKAGGVGNGKWQAVYLASKPDAVSEAISALLGGSGEQARLAPDFAALVNRRSNAQLGAAAAQLKGMLSQSGAQAYCLLCAGVAGSGEEAAGASAQAPTPLPIPGWLGALIAPR
ncbi:signal peptide peptidase SppA [Novosphingobium sp. 1949]|uniref:Signal peptide peptidase SppA n=1 Tax=Novosphingobium organovorum TaxID=2930092 RepID=A0ABT0BDT3_9SPHN|nr:signal peptide peptidase SppA [Novosphingobium organovorum]MCJ2183220.1 signal peptide peptidase SppA [Novosphingobium organovorum]